MVKPDSDSKVDMDSVIEQRLLEVEAVEKEQNSDQNGASYWRHHGHICAIASRWDKDHHNRHGLILDHDNLRAQGHGFLHHDH